MYSIGREVNVVVTGGQPGEDLEAAAVAVAVITKRGPDVDLAGKVWSSDGFTVSSESSL